MIWMNTAIMIHTSILTELFLKNDSEMFLRAIQFVEQNFKERKD